jgi:hypothetical protein
MHECVVHECAADLEHAQLVGVGDRLALELERELLSTSRRQHAELLRQGLRDGAEVDGLPLHVHPARIEPREVEQIGGELREPVDLLAHRSEELAPRLLVELLVRH